ncbi:MAG: tetratricopeptide repeat protein [Anaerolineae bacterium]|nr:tetratricopeptide repeat protein [Anaerolineae bacterium]
MPTITLQEYHERIEKLIDESMLTDAVSHCRHILDSHPSHIHTYRLLAKALLEQHDYDGASDLFQRVLSADPNDFVAHVGLSIVRAEESQVEDALWHLQRAFEIEPYNAAIQEELRRHYAQFSDMAIDRIPLSSGALARLYIKGELYQQAVQELRHAVQNSQDRVDLEVLLAEALWRNEQRVDAEEMCLNVLQKLPNCIAVNAILSEIWLQTGRIGESQKYLRRLLNLTSMDKESLNLDTAVGRAFRADGAPPLPEKVEIEFKGDGVAVMPTATTAGKGPSADWMNDVTFDSDMGEKFDYQQAGVVGESPSGMHNYDWMADVNDDLASEESLPVESEWFVDETLQAKPAPEDDWLAGIDTAVAADDFDLLFADDDSATLESADAAELEPEDWFLAQSESELQLEETFASEQLAPAWLVSLVDEPDIPDVGADMAEADMGSDWFAESRKEESLPTAETSMPDWLSNLVDDGAPPAASDFAAVELAADDDQNEWVIDEHAEDHWDEADYTEEEMPDWLQGAATLDAPETPAAEVVADDMFAADEEPQPTAAADMPDWLLKQTGELEPDITSATDGDEFDDWLAADAAVAAEAPEPKEESLFTGWLSDEPEEAPTAVKGAAALGLTAMFASLDDELPAAKEPAAAEMDEWDDLFAGAGERAGTAMPPTPAETDEDDWLSALAPAAAADGGEDTAVSLDDLRGLFADDTVQDTSEISLDSDWLSPAEDVWADDLVADDLADLTPESTDVAAEFAQTFGGQAYLDDDLAEAEEEEVPDWLLGNDQTRLGKAEEMAMGMMGDEDEAALPERPQAEDDFASLSGDWLSELTAGGAEEEFFDEEALDVTPEAEGVPDWLAGFEIEASEAEEDAEESWAAAAAPSDEPMGADEALPDWLSGLTDVTVTEEPPHAPAMAAFTAGEEEDELFDVLADMSAGESPLADWLADDDFAPFEEALADETVSDTAVPSGGLTSWLKSMPADEPAPSSEPEVTARADIPEIPSEELFATDQENLPDWLSPATGDLIVTAEDESNLPDWLLDAAADVPAQLDSEDLFATDEADLLPGYDEEPLEEAVDEGLTAVGLTALFSSIHDEPATLADLGADTEMDWLADMGEAEEEDLSTLHMADEMELDWLAEEGDVDEMETAVAPAPESELMDVGPDASADGLDDAISWLEELASQQETPVEELPTVAETLLAEELTVVELDTLAHQEMGDEEFDLGFDDEALDEAWAEAFPVDVMAVSDESDMPAAEEETGGESWLDVLLADEEAEAASLLAPPEDDEEAAMAWLEGLAANQGAPLEELPTLQGRSQRDLDGLVDEAQADLDDALAWMDNLAEEPETKEEWPELDEELLATMMAGTAVTPTPKSTSPEADDELAAALNFLDEQVKAEGITPAVSGGTAVVPDVELIAALDWLEETVEVEPASDMADELAFSDEWEVAEAVTDTAAVAEDAEIDLMTELAVVEKPAEAELTELWEDESWDWEQPESITDLLTVAAKPPTSVPSEGAEEDLALLDMPDDPDAAMEWLARIATADGDEAEIPTPSLAMTAWDEPVEDEEMEEVWAEPVGAALSTAVTEATTTDETDMLLIADDLDISDMPDDPDEAMNWLLNMAQGDETIDFDMQPPPITPSEDAKFAIDYGEPAQAISIEPEMEIVEEMDTAVIDEIEMADDTFALADEVEDEAGWLEDMLGEDFEIDFEMQPPPITPSEDAKFAIDYGEPAIAISPEPELEMVEEVSTAVMNESETADETLTLAAEAEDEAGWLEDMLGEDFEIDFEMQPPPITPSEDAKFAIDYGEPSPPVIEEPAAMASSLDGLAEEDVIAAMPEDPDEAMAWLQKIADEQTDSLEPTMAPDDALLPAWLTGDDTEVAEFDALPAAEAELDLMADLGADMGDDLSDSLPDWLAADSGRSSSTGQTGWLTAVEDLDVISWLAAEDEATMVDFDEVAMADVGELRPSGKPTTGRLPSLTAAEPDLPAESSEVPRLTTDELNASQLADVRQVLAEKRYEEAVTHYQQLIASGTATLGLITELESLADEYPTQPAFRRLLGDAYMRNGQLQKALNTYRVALDHL